MLHLITSYQFCCVNISSYHQVPVNESTDAFEKESSGRAGFDRLDLSANAGIQFKNGLFITTGYLMRLTNISDKESTYKNGGILLTLGFLLASSK